MSSSSNSFLRGQRKSDLLELAETVGLQKYVQNLSLVKLSRLLRVPFAPRELASRPAHCLKTSPACGAVALRPSRMAVLRLSADSRCRHKRNPMLPAVLLKGDRPVTNMRCWFQHRRPEEE